MPARSLCHVDDSTPGITRRRRGRAWQYFRPDGSRVTDRDEIDRLNAVGLPPAYERAWFCPDANGHVQAVGWDARGRKQYRYHPDFRAERETLKYERLADFGRALPRLRRRIVKDLAGRKLGRATVIAAVVRLIDETRMRVGNEEYAKANRSFGATTLRNRHARVSGGKLRISYPGKHGIKRTVTVTDRNLVRIARRTQDLPGQHLFEYVDEEGETCRVTSSDVNDYVREAMGEAFTAKDFRTWGATVIAFEEMVKRARGKGRVHLNSMMEPVAEALGNTVAISRKSYVHPAVIDAAKDAGALGETELPRATTYLSSAERGLIAFLQSLGRKRRRRPNGGRSKGKSG